MTTVYNVDVYMSAVYFCRILINELELSLNKQLLKY